LFRSGAARGSSGIRLDADDAADGILGLSQGGGVAASFGGQSSSTNALIGTRQAGDLLTKTSWWGGGIFIFLAFVLQLMSSRAAAPRWTRRCKGRPRRSPNVGT